MGMLYELDEVERKAVEPLTRYHEQRDAMLGLNSDHFSSPNYSRGAVRRYEPRSRRRSWKLTAWRVLLGIVFFGLLSFVFLFGLMEWRVM